MSVLEVGLTSAAGNRDRIELITMKGLGLRVLETATLPDAGTIQHGTPGVPLDSSRFSHVTLDVRVSGGATTTTLNVDGAQTVATNFMSHEYLSAPVLAVGLTYLPKTSAEWTIRYDNVTIKVD